MAGIINYFHGETGIATDLRWIVDKDGPELVLGLADAVHRHEAYDYGGDVSVDPSIKPGDRVMYVRLDETCGLWVTERDVAMKGISRSIRRVRKYRLLIEWLRDICSQSADGWERACTILASRTCLPIDREVSAAANRRHERPSTEVSFFLSYSSRNVLLAHELYSDLRHDGRAEIWFDLAHAGEQPDHPSRIANWLRAAVFQCRGLVLLLTREAAESSWVRREIEWAQDVARVNAGFQFIILKCDDIDATAFEHTDASIIDCRGLSRSVGIAEELFAAIYDRVGRRKCMAEPEYNYALAPDEHGWESGDFESDSGRAITLEWSINDRVGIEWAFTYERSSRHFRLVGSGLYHPIDLQIRWGDDVAWHYCRRRNGTRFRAGTRLVMRSNDLAITPDAVLDHYYRTTFEACHELKYRGDKVFLELLSEDRFGRQLGTLHCEQPDGQTLPLEHLMFFGVTDYTSTK